MSVIEQAGRISGPGEILSGRNYPDELDVHAIKRLIPHRNGILFICRVTLLSQERYVGYATWKADSMGLDGHFPDEPIVPAVYVIEAAAQAAGAGMLAHNSETGADGQVKLGVLAGVRRCIFMKPILPGHEIRFDLTAKRASSDFSFVIGSAFHKDTQVASLDFMLAFAPRDKIFG